ncbi:MAG: MATE family efflux transporter [Chitinophagaceae bacterium]|nr:MATE family efflux transporter [Chitinophagaceae bacterium]
MYLCTSMLNPSLQVDFSNRKIIQMALPVAVAILIPQLIILTNTFFIGNYHPQGNAILSQSLLAASGIAGIFFLTLSMIGYGLSSGLLMLFSRRAGEGDEADLVRLFPHGIFLSLILSVVLMVLTTLLAPAIFTLAIHNEQIRDAAISFISIRFWGLPFVVVAQVCNSFMLATSNSSKIVAGTFGQTLVHMLFDYLLIFGHGGFPEMGLDGSAWASVLAEIVYAFTALAMVRWHPDLKRFRLPLITRYSIDELRMIMLKSSPLLVQYFLSIGAWQIFFFFVEHLGEAESAVSQVLRTVFGIVGLGAWALASTSNSMVSNLIGQKAFNDVIPLVHRITKISFILAFVLGFPLFLFPGYFLSLLTNNATLVQLGTGSLRIVVIATWMLSVSTIYFNAVVGTGNTRLNMFFELTAIVFYLCYNMVVVEIKKAGLAWAWGSEFVYWFTLFSFSAFYLYRGSWRKQASL